MLIKGLRLVLVLVLAFTLIIGFGNKALARPMDKVPVFIGLEGKLSAEKQSEVEGEVTKRGGSIIHRYRIVNAFAAQLPRQAITAIRSRAGVKYVEEDAVVHAIQESTPWGVTRIGADSVHTTGNKGSGVKVAILDSGIDRSHPDLVDNIDSGRNFVGWFFINPNNWDDDYGHGTHVAGIVAAADNDIGVIGVAPKASLCIAKVLNADGMGYWSWVVAGIDWAVASGADVINMSLGGPYSETVNNACQNAYEAGVVIVAAAGNDSGPVSYPAALSSVMAVSATDEADNLATWSNFGPQIELAAPGVGVDSTMPTYHVTMNDLGYTQDYSSMSGTSMASPHVAGTAALVIASGTITDDGNGLYGIANEVRFRMCTTAEDLGDPRWDYYYGHGLVDAESAAEAGTPNNPPVANDDSNTTLEDTAVIIDVLANDTDADVEDTLAITNLTQPSNGTVNLNTTDQTVSYSPHTDFNGIDSFTYTANDGKVDSNVATVSITVTPVNDAPIAQDDAYTTDENTTLNVSAPGVLGNDNDVDGDSLTAILLSNVSHGSLTINGDGSFTYTPDTGFTGTDSFGYTADDGNGGVTTATATITVNPVNQPPVAVDDAYSTDEDGILDIAAPGVLSNDSDEDSNPLTAELGTDVSNGSLNLNADGSFSYQPHANFNGTDSFTYTARDDKGGSDTATVTIAVNLVNDLPVAEDDAYTTDENTILNVSAPGVLGNDSDVDDDSLTAILLSDVTHGSLTLNGDGSFTYTPDTGFTGTDSFRYTADDGNGGVDSATATITVESASPTIHVESIDMSIYRSFWKWSQVQATILIHDGSGNPVSGVTVTGDWSGAYKKTGVSEVTSSDGKVTFKSKWGSGTFTFTVTDVSKSGWIYEPSQNKETSDSINAS